MRNFPAVLTDKRKVSRDALIQFAGTGSVDHDFTSYWGFIPGPFTISTSRERKSGFDEKEEVWQYVIMMILACRDLMEGNPKLAEIGFGEEANGHNAIAAGFQGQRVWTDYLPNGDFMEAILNSSFDWNGLRHHNIMATENDSLNSVSIK